MESWMPIGSKGRVGRTGVRGKSRGSDVSLPKGTQSLSPAGPWGSRVSPWAGLYNGVYLAP